MNWREDVTRCIHVKKDGNACKLDCIPGEYVCEHHCIGIDDFIVAPVHSIAMFRDYFPKNHNPACDRKGQNDCDCPERSFGQLSALTLKRALATSLSRTKGHKDMVHEQMLYRTRMIRKYYESIDESDLWLGMPKPEWRQFRFFVYNEARRKMVVRKVPDVIRDKTTLLRHLRKMAPHHCYVTSAFWMDPQNIGPDPNSKSGFKKYKDKNSGMWTSSVNNVFLGQEMYFDIDYEMETFEQAAQETLRLSDYYDNVDTGCEKKMQYVFSGGKGFHMIDYGWNMSQHFGDDRKLMSLLESRATERHPHNGQSKGISWARQDLSRSLKKHLIRNIRKQGILLDYEVTVDPRRIIRLPGTIHGKRGRVCRVISKDELHNFEPGPTLW